VRVADASPCAPGHLGERGGRRRRALGGEEGGGGLWVGREEASSGEMGERKEEAAGLGEWEIWPVRWIVGCVFGERDAGQNFIYFCWRPV
jgi:hypothetical protein